MGKKNMKAYLIIACALISNQAIADTILKCENYQGKVYYSNTVCDTGDKATFKTVNPAIADSSELRAWARRNPAQRQSAAPQGPAIAPPKYDSIECGNAVRMYEYEKNLRNPKSLNYRSKEVYRKCGYYPE